MFWCLKLGPGIGPVPWVRLVSRGVAGGVLAAWDLSAPDGLVLESLVMGPVLEPNRSLGTGLGG